MTRCLKSIFGEESYEFRIQFEKKRGKTDARFVFLPESGGSPLDPMTAAGGGCVDVAAFALRLSVLMLTHSRKLLVLDEPFRFLSAEYQPIMAELLLTLSREMEVQIVMVTHSEGMKIGKVIQL